MSFVSTLAARLGIAAIALVAPSLACSGKADTDTDAKAQSAKRGTRPNDARPADTARIAPTRLSNRVPHPDSVRALYVNAWAAGSRSRMADLIRIADSTEINAFVVDVKESDTYLAYTGTNIPLAREIGADQRPATTWLPALVDTLKAHNIYSIARIVVFKDRMLAEKKPEFAIRHVNGSVWRDNKGGAWVNPYDKRVWDYNIAIAREALEMGFSELQWDYVRFPDVTNTARKVMSYPGAGDKSRADNIRDFILYSKEKLQDLNVPVTADVFGLVTTAEGDVDIGQNWERIIASADAVLPMTYPSHYYAGLYGFKNPHAHPYEILRLATQDAVERTKFLADSAHVKVGEIRPWIEAMSIRGVHFGPAELRLQMQGVYDSGLKGWSMWNPGSRYAEFLDALRPSNGGLSAVERHGWKPPSWPLPRNRLSQVIQKRDARARVAADTTRRDSIRAPTAPTGTSTRPPNGGKRPA